MKEGREGERYAMKPCAMLCSEQVVKKRRKKWTIIKINLPFPLVCSEQCGKGAKLDALQSMDGQWTLAPSQESSLKAAIEVTAHWQREFILLYSYQYIQHTVWTTLVSYSCSILLHACCILLLWGHVPYVAAAVNTIRPKLDLGVSSQTPAAEHCIT